MTDSSTDKYSAGEQGLGYIYQARLALLRLLQLPEGTSVFLEKDDDLDFIGVGKGKSLASLKHKAVGDRLSNLSIDFWKSVNADPDILFWMSPTGDWYPVSIQNVFGIRKVAQVSGDYIRIESYAPGAQKDVATFCYAIWGPNLRQQYKPR